MISGPAHSVRKTWAKAETLKNNHRWKKTNESRALRTESRNLQNVDQLCNENIWQDWTPCLWLLLQLLCQGRLKLSATSPDCQHSQRYLTCANEATEAPSTFYNTSSPQMRWLSEAARLEMKAIPESAPWTELWFGVPPGGLCQGHCTLLWQSETWQGTGGWMVRTGNREWVGRAE